MILPQNIIRVMKGEINPPYYFYPLYLPASLYSLLARIRASLYRSRILKSLKLPCPVISIGNLAAGGTGKTPFTIYLCAILKDRGLKPAIVMRGYKGTLEGRTNIVSDGMSIVMTPSEAGDEAVMLAKRLPGVPVVMGSNRHEAGMLAIKNFRPDVIVLDDGYQHMALDRDLDILLLDAKRPFGNGHTLPFGYLREPKTSMDRADLVVLTRSDGVVSEPAGLPVDLPVIRTEYRVSTVYNIYDGNKFTPASLSGKRVMPVAAVADPASFSLILKGLNVKILQGKFYPDHHPYIPEDLAEIEAEARRLGADFVVVTEKDAVKLAALPPSMPPALAVGIRLEVIKGTAVLDVLLDKIFGGRAG